MTVTVGIDLGIDDELDAEALLAAVSDHLGDAGFPDHVIGTYAVAAPGRRHAAFAVELVAAAALARDRVAEALTRARATVRSHGHDPPGWDDPVVVVESEAAEDDPRAAGGLEAIRAHGARESGRLVVFPGVGTLVGTVTANQVRATAIEDLVDLGGGVVAGDARIRTRDFVRPRWVGGRLLLHVQPGPGGCLVPFEEPDPHRCCARH